MAVRKVEADAMADLPSKRELVITRVFDAPRELVWKAWTDPARVMRWWGPKTFTSHSCKIDLRVGGKYLFCMRSPEGRDYWSTGTYREIVPIEKIVYTDSFSDEHGNVVPASAYGIPGHMAEVLIVTVTLEDLGSRTRMTLKHAGFPKEVGELAEMGWNESFDKLAQILGPAGAGEPAGNDHRSVPACQKETPAVV